MAGATIRLLRALAGKALIQTLPGGRYDVHELLRQYGEEKLNETGAAASVKQMHSRYYLEFLAQRRDTIHSPRMVEMLDEIAADFDSIRAAWYCAVEEPDDQLISGAVDCLTWFCDRRGRFFEHEELYALAQEQFAPLPGEKPRLVWAQLMARRAALMMEYDPTDERIALSQSFYEKSLEVIHMYDDRFETAYTTFRWGDFLARTGNTEAIMPLEQALALFQDMGDQFYVSECLFWIGLHYGNVEKLDQFVDYLLRSANFKLRLGDKNGAAWAFGNVAVKQFHEGHSIDAEYHVQEALRLFREVGNPGGVSDSITKLAFISYHMGNIEGVHSLASEALTIIVGARLSQAEPGARDLLGRIDCILNEDYERTMQQARDLYKTHTEFVADLELMALCGLEHYQDARQTFARLLTRIRKKISFIDITELLPFAAIILANQGQEERAVELFGLIFAQPTAYVGWVSRWGLVTRLLARLENDLGAEVYAAAWERGKALDLAVVEGMLREEFAQEH